jgi:hypothetical protein
MPQKKTREKKVEFDENKQTEQDLDWQELSHFYSNLVGLEIFGNALKKKRNIQPVKWFEFRLLHSHLHQMVFHLLVSKRFVVVDNIPSN